MTPSQPFPNRPDKSPSADESRTADRAPPPRFGMERRVVAPNAGRAYRGPWAHPNENAETRRSQARFAESLRNLHKKDNRTLREKLGIGKKTGPFGTMADRASLTRNRAQSRFNAPAASPINSTVAQPANAPAAAPNNSAEATEATTTQDIPAVAQPEMIVTTFNVPESVTVESVKASIQELFSDAFGFDLSSSTQFLHFSSPAAQPAMHIMTLNVPESVTVESLEASIRELFSDAVGFDLSFSTQFLHGATSAAPAQNDAVGSSSSSSTETTGTGGESDTI